MTEIVASDMASPLELEKMSTFENHGRGDAVQIMVSTNEKLLNGKNEGAGWRTRQLGGYLSDTSLQLLSKNLLSLDTQNGNLNTLQHGAIESIQSDNPTAQHQWVEITPISSPCSTTETR